MRTDITHRALSIELNRFVYGNFHYNENGKPVISRFAECLRNTPPKQWLINEKTLGLFTNAYDKKSVTIFEGDEVEHRSKRLNCENQEVNHFVKGFVYYDESKLQFRILVNDSTIFKNGVDIGFFDPEEWEIVGNINKVEEEMQIQPYLKSVIFKS